MILLFPKPTETAGDKINRLEGEVGYLEHLVDELRRENRKLRWWPFRSSYWANT